MTRWMSILPALDAALTRAPRWDAEFAPRLTRFRFGHRLATAPGVTDADVWYVHAACAVHVTMSIGLAPRFIGDDQPRKRSMTLTIEEPAATLDGVSRADVYRGLVCPLELHMLDRELRRRGMTAACTFAIPHEVAQDAERSVAAQRVQRAWRACAALAQRRAARAAWRACAAEVPLVPGVGVEFRRAEARFAHAVLHSPHVSETWPVSGES